MRDKVKVSADEVRAAVDSSPVVAGSTPHTLSAGVQRAQISFRQVNKRGSPDYDPGLQRHHLLPRQLLSQRCFSALFAQVGRARVGFDDFRTNGLLLPATEEATQRLGMPLHRGPHRRYNEIVMERVGRIEARWIEASASDPDGAMNEALMRLRLLQIALRRRLLAERKRMILNKKDPLGKGYDFAELDAMAEALWASTGRS
ncbi:MAG: AHH domain-containing protein [Pseudomonadota bacterium]